MFVSLLLACVLFDGLKRNEQIQRIIHPAPQQIWTAAPFVRIRASREPDGEHSRLFRLAQIQMADAPMTRPRCALGRVVASGVDTEAMKRTAWLRDRILFVRMDDDRLTINDLAALWDIGARLYPAKGKE